MNQRLETLLYGFAGITSESQSRKMAQLNKIAAAEGKFGLSVRILHETRNAALSLFIIANVGPIGLNMIISGIEEDNLAETMAGIGAVTISAMLSRVFIGTLDSTSLILDTKTSLKPER